MRCLLLLALFFPLIHNEAARYPIHIDEAQSVSTLLVITGYSCGEIEYQMIGEPYYLGAELHVWNKDDCDPEPFRIVTGYWWADWVCTANDCIEVTIP